MLSKYKPGIPKRYLLLVAAFVWTIAGCFLLIKGSVYVARFCDDRAIRFPVAIVVGFLFFAILFIRISSRHIHRIRSMKIMNPCFFSFFNFKSYLLMILMIGMGITLRALNIVSPSILYTFYVSMGIPLLISAVRFYAAFYTYNPAGEDPDDH